MTATIVSLEKDFKRRDEVSKKLDKFNYKYNFFKAVEPKISENYIKTLNINSINSLSPGEIGCALSHAFNYANLESRYLMMLEDDVTPLLENPFTNKFPNDLKDGEILFLGVSAKDEWLAYKSKVTKLGINCVELDKLSIPFLRGTCAYILTKNTAMEILELQKEQLNVADAWKYFYSKNIVKTFYYSEYFSHPKDFASSNIEAERSKNFSNEKILRKILKNVIFVSYKIIRFLTRSKYIKK
jgi:GR25 family glycosyltransferase involved in LPS biosynthesis